MGVKFIYIESDNGDKFAINYDFISDICRDGKDVVITMGNGNKYVIDVELDDVIDTLKKVESQFIKQ